jgi:hypothetical protein
MILLSGESGFYPDTHRNLDIHPANLVRIIIHPGEASDWLRIIHAQVCLRLSHHLYLDPETYCRCYSSWNITSMTRKSSNNGNMGLVVAQREPCNVDGSLRSTWSFWRAWSVARVRHRKTAIRTGVRFSSKQPYDWRSRLFKLGINPAFRRRILRKRL